MALGGQVVDFVRLYLLNDPHQVVGVRQIPIMQDEPMLRVVLLLIQVIHPVGFEKSGSSLDAVHIVILLQKKFGKISSVLGLLCR